MGLLKRILRETSSKILHKLGAKPGSRRSMQLDGLAPASGHHALATGAKGKQSRKKRRSSGKSRAGDSAALLMAAKNHLPPVQFHHVHGPNAVLAKNKCVARRTQSFCHALVFSNRIILPNERVYIKVLEIAKGWSGTIRFGFTSVDPATLRCQVPKHACPDMTNAGHTWARALADEVVRRNSVIHFSYNTSGYIHYGINNQDCGVFYANVNTSQHLWFIVDIYGLTAAVELIDPRRINTGFASSELDVSRLGNAIDGFESEQEDIENIYGDRSTMFKSTGAMDQIASSRVKRKRGRKGNRHLLDPLIYGQWSSNVPASQPLMTLNGAPQARPMLPNLSSIILPAAQQNIYTPMPSLSRPPPPVPAVSVTNNHPTDSHDYYQIMTQGRVPAAVARNSRVSSTGAANFTYKPVMANTSASTLNSSQVTHNSAEADQREFEEEEMMISNRLGSFQLHDDARLQQQIASSSTKSTKSTAPVAAVRRRLQTNNPVQTISKREANPKRDIANIRGMSTSSTSLAGAAATSTTTTKACAKASASSGNVKPRPRHSNKVQKTPSIRDTNKNNPPPAKDCPICFERPINCVLYQCGHMCTCYECGVKQWRTQSRTCPICRTIIKDVIKTYMS